MARLEELQELWQSQPQGAQAVDSRGMHVALRRFGRRQNLIYTVKAVLVVAVGWLGLRSLKFSAISAAGTALLAGGAMAILIADWRRQLSIARLDFAKPSAGFVESVLERLHNSNMAFRKLMWLYMIPVCVGVNLLFVANSIAAHLAATLGPLAGCAVGLKLRAKRFAGEYRPIIERLTAMKEALEERAE